MDKCLAMISTLELCCRRPILYHLFLLLRGNAKQNLFQNPLKKSPQPPSPTFRTGVSLAALDIFWEILSMGQFFLKCWLILLRSIIVYPVHWVREDGGGVVGLLGTVFVLKSILCEYCRTYPFGLKLIVFCCAHTFWRTIFSQSPRFLGCNISIS